MASRSNARVYLLVYLLVIYKATISCYFLSTRIWKQFSSISIAARVLYPVLPVVWFTFALIFKDIIISVLLMTVTNCFVVGTSLLEVQIHLSVFGMSRSCYALERSQNLSMFSFSLPCNIA